MNNIVFEKYIHKNRNKLFSLLLLGDADKNIVNQYINNGSVFIAKYNKKIVGVILLLFHSNYTEIKNIAVSKYYQQNGIGSNLISFAIDNIKSNFNQIIVGTGDADVNNIRFYLRNGFRFYDIRKDFFTKYYKPIFSDGILLKDMVVFQKFI